MVLAFRLAKSDQKLYFDNNLRDREQLYYETLS